jgi:hypothetical protein
VTNLRFRRIVLFTGVISTRRTIAQVEFEMPREVESWEQGVAWVTWYVDDHIDMISKATSRLDWLKEGRKNRHLLPWERQRVASEEERVAYESRPRCQVQRDWARVALRQLASQIAAVDDDTDVTFHFNGEALMIRCHLPFE